MAYRTKTYIAGDWEHDNDAIDKLYQWKNDNILSFDFIDAHEYTQARDTSLNCSIKKSLKERLDRSKTFILVVGEFTNLVTAGSCRYCSSNNSTKRYCVRGHNLDFRSYIKYECEEALKANMSIIVLYNSNQVIRTWCPEILRNKGKHYPMKKSIGWDYQGINLIIKYYS